PPFPSTTLFRSPSFSRISGPGTWPLTPTAWTERPSMRSGTWPTVSDISSPDSACGPDWPRAHPGASEASAAAPPRAVAPRSRTLRSMMWAPGRMGTILDTCRGRPRGGLAGAFQHLDQLLGLLALLGLVAAYHRADDAVVEVIAQEFGLDLGQRGAHGL